MPSRACRAYVDAEGNVHTKMDGASSNEAVGQDNANPPRTNTNSNDLGGAAGGIGIRPDPAPAAQAHNASTRPTNLSLTGTVPYSIVQALDESSRRKSAPNTAQGRSAPIDVLAAVLSVSIDLSDTSRPSAALLVVDPSLIKGTCGRIKLYGRECVRMLSGGGRGRVGGTAGYGGNSHAIGRGDVVRFNRLDVVGDYRYVKPNASVGETSSNTNNSGGSAMLNTVICEMRPSWLNPEAGLPFARVGFADATATNHRDDPSTAAGGKVISHDELPDSMATPSQIVHDLLKWFQEHYPSQGPTALLQADLFCSCKRRRLAEITNPNLLSDVTVKVISCDPGALMSPAMSIGSGKKRRRSANVTQQGGCVATLSDGNGHDDMMPLYDCRRFKAALESAISTGSRILLTSLLSRRSASSGAGASASCLSVVAGSSSIILVPTADTTIVMLSDDQEDGTTDTSPRRLRGQGRGSSNYPSQYWDSQSQMFGNTPNSPKDGPLHADVHTASEVMETRIVTSRLMDIFVDDCNTCLTDNDMFEDADRLASTLIRPGMGSMPPQYRNATLTLDSNAAPDSFIVKAGGEIMEILCCSCPANDLIGDKAADDVSKTRLTRNYVRDVLRGFVCLDVKLQWTLRKEENKSWWTAVDVMLLEL